VRFHRIPVAGALTAALGAATGIASGALDFALIMLILIGSMILSVVIHLARNWNRQVLRFDSIASLGVLIVIVSSVVILAFPTSRGKHFIVIFAVGATIALHFVVGRVLDRWLPFGANDDDIQSSH
jgi:cation transport ATPase